MYIYMYIYIYTYSICNQENANVMKPLLSVTTETKNKKTIPSLMGLWTSTILCFAVYRVKLVHPWWLSSNSWIRKQQKCAHKFTYMCKNVHVASHIFTKIWEIWNGGKVQDQCSLSVQFLVRASAPLNSLYFFKIFLEKH